MLIPVGHEHAADGLSSEFFRDAGTDDAYAIVRFPGKPNDFFPLRLSKQSEDFELITIPGHAESCRVFYTRDEAYQFLLSLAADFI
jgi:hypothetical protein